MRQGAALRQGGGRHQGDAGVDLAEPERAELAGLGVAVEVDVVEGLQQLLPVPQQAVDRGPHGGELRRDYGGGDTAWVAAALRRALRLSGTRCREIEVRGDRDAGGSRCGGSAGLRRGRVRVEDRPVVALQVRPRLGTRCGARGAVARRRRLHLVGTGGLVIVLVLVLVHACACACACAGMGVGSGVGRGARGWRAERRPRSTSRARHARCGAGAAPRAAAPAPPPTRRSARRRFE